MVLAELTESCESPDGVRLPTREMTGWRRSAAGDRRLMACFACATGVCSPLLDGMRLHAAECSRQRAWSGGSGIEKNVPPMLVADVRLELERWQRPRRAFVRLRARVALPWRA